MEEKYWKEQKAPFNELCNMVAKGNLVCLTGAGISKSLENKQKEKLPDWQGLLERIYDRMKTEPGINFKDKEDTIQSLLNTDDAELLKGLKTILEGLSTDKSSINEADKETIKKILAQNLIAPATAGAGERLTAVASLLHKTNPKVFKEILQEIVTTDGDQTTKMHEVITELNPLGIMTYNYDTAHEAAWDHKKVDYDLIVPADREKIRKMMRDGLKGHFILKAHGTTKNKDSLVLTNESYSELFTIYSYYKTLVQHILMNHQLLIVGFGMSDPDFDKMIQDLFTTFGGPIQNHVVIAHESTRSRKDVLYQHKYGFMYLYVKEFSDIPDVLRDCTEFPGSYVKDIIKSITSNGSNGVEKRTEAHRNLRKLNNVAKNIVADELMNKISYLSDLIRDKNSVIPGSYRVFRLSEYVYSLGCLLDKDTDIDGRRRKFLIEKVIKECRVPKVVCHALYQIKDYLDKDDLEMIREWRKRFEDDNYFKNNGFEDGQIDFDMGSGRKISRNEIYCGFLDALVQSKYYMFENEDD